MSKASGVSTEIWIELLGYASPERGEDPLFDDGPRKATIEEIAEAIDQWREGARLLSPHGRQSMWMAKLNALRAVVDAGLIEEVAHEAFLHGDAHDLLETVEREHARAMLLARHQQAGAPIAEGHDDTEAESENRFRPRVIERIG